jgi:hypothetical protein
VQPPDLLPGQQRSTPLQVWEALLCALVDNRDEEDDDEPEVPQFQRRALRCSPELTPAVTGPGRWFRPRISSAARGRPSAAGSHPAASADS